MTKFSLKMLIYALALAVDILYTFQLRGGFHTLDTSEIANFVLIVIVVACLWALENVALVSVQKTEKNKSEA